jgi:hypothetical protein
MAQIRVAAMAVFAMSALSRTLDLFTAHMQTRHVCATHWKRAQPLS